VHRYGGSGLHLSQEETGKLNLQLAVGQFYLPSAVKKKRLAELLDATAEAFQAKAPTPEGLSFDQRLHQYALFTRDQATESLRRGDQQEIKFRLYQAANAMAGRLKQNFHVVDAEDTMKLAKLVYRILKIEFAGDRTGKVQIRQCFFSSFYSGEVCRILSSLDEGLLEGLSGRIFRFSQRITEGHEYCLAHLSARRSSP
jgi:hypothetical protein